MENVEVSVVKDKTIITLDVCLHPKDVERVQDLIIDFWNNHSESTKKFMEEIKKESPVEDASHFAQQANRETVKPDAVRKSCTSCLKYGINNKDCNGKCPA